jgi:hypothetical protein
MLNDAPHLSEADKRNLLLYLVIGQMETLVKARFHANLTRSDILQIILIA